MRTAIISDIHSNLEALKAVLRSIKKKGVDRIVCLGDVVGYGADPDECCSLVRESADFSLMGNHDAAVTGAMDEGFYYESARFVIKWTRQSLSDDNYKWLYSLPYTKFEGEVGFFHGAPIMPSGFFYVVQTQEAHAHCQVFSRLPSIAFIGHAHLTHIFQIGQKKAKLAEAKEVTLTPHYKFIVNCGSVGQPRDKDPRARYVLWDSDAVTVDFEAVEYDIDMAARKIVRAGLDEKFAKRLYLGV